MVILRSFPETEPDACPPPSHPTRTNTAITASMTSRFINHPSCTALALPETISRIAGPGETCSCPCRHFRILLGKRTERVKPFLKNNFRAKRGFTLSQSTSAGVLPPRRQIKISSGFAERIWRR